MVISVVLMSSSTCGHILVVCPFPSPCISRGVKHLWTSYLDFLGLDVCFLAFANVGHLRYCLLVRDGRLAKRLSDLRLLTYGFGTLMSFHHGALFFSFILSLLLLCFFHDY